MNLKEVKMKSSIPAKPPKPPKTQLHDKLAHLTTQERRQALKILEQIATNHNRDVIENKANLF